MKKIAFLAFALFLAGCSPQYPLSTNLSLKINSQPARLYDNATTAAMKGHDSRKDSAVIVYRFKGEPEIWIPNETEPHIFIAKQLAAALQKQGLMFKDTSPVRIQLDLMELLATVTRPKLLYSTTARSHLTLTVKNRGMVLTKSYTREANRDSVTRPPVEELVKILDKQLTDIVDQILQDDEVRTTISTNDLQIRGK